MLVLAAVLAVLLSGLNARVQAQPVVPVASWLAQQGRGPVLIDASGSQTLAQVIPRFEKGEAVLGSPDRILPAGGKTALWLQLDLPPVTTATPRMLAVPHPGMNRVDLYWPQPGGDWRVERSGDWVPVAQWPVRYLYPTFELVQQPGETRAGYLRVEHNHPISVPWTVSTNHDFQEASKRWHFLLGVYAGLAALMIVFSAVNAYFWRDSIHSYYAAYVLVVAVAQLSMTGLAGEYFWPEYPRWNDIATSMLTAAAAGLGHLFMRELVVERGVAWVNHLMRAMAVLGGMLALCFLLIGRDPFFALSGPYYLASFAISLGVALWYAWRVPRVGLWVLAGIIFLLVGAMFPLLRNMELLPVSFMTQHGAQIGVALELPLLLLALSLRSRQRRDNRTRVGAMARVDPLTGMANHGVMLERLTHLLQHQQRDPMAGVVLRVRIGNLQQIRDEYGLQVAQMALVHAGACITQVAREGDTVARHKEGDFVLVLDGRVTRDQISEMGQRLIARGLASSDLLPPGAVLQLKVAVAAPPFRAVGVAALLQLLESTVAELAARPGKALRFLV